MDSIRRRMKRLRRRFFMKTSATRSQGGKVVSLHRVKISEGDIYQQSTSSQTTIKRNLVTEFKHRKSQELNDVVLEIMGTENSTASVFGRPIHNELAICFEDIATSGLRNGQRKDLLEAYIPPVNCKLIDAPVLNPEIKKAISDFDIKQDKIIRNKQKQISSAIACLGEALTLLMSKDTRDPTVSRLITDCARILCDSQYNDSVTRRNFILNSLKGDMKKHLTNTKICGMLFGKSCKEAQCSKTAEPKNNSENNSKVEISTVPCKISTPKARSPNRNSISKEQIENYDSRDQKTHGPCYRTPKNPIKDFIMVPLDTRSPRSSKQINKRDSRQRERSRTPIQSNASTSSSPRRR